jgi:hypothetical protein
MPRLLRTPTPTAAAGFSAGNTATGDVVIPGAAEAQMLSGEDVVPAAGAVVSRGALGSACAGFWGYTRVRGNH